MVGDPVPDRIAMHIVEMGGVIILIADRVLPKPPLPDPSLALRNPARGAMLAYGKAFRECLLDRLPAARKIGVAFWQRPDAMHVIGQEHPGVDVIRSSRARGRDRVMQCRKGSCGDG
jgi:hypothetical protein